MKQEGITLITVVLIIPLILLAVAGVLLFFMIELGRYEAQTAAESAALAASQELCASRECWGSARLAAAAALNRQRVQNSIGYDSQLPDLQLMFADFKDREADTLTGAYQWDLPAENLIVKIERGIYHDINADPQVVEMRFESLETPTGLVPPQTSRGSMIDKAIPRHMISNAVKVVVERPQLESALPGILDLGHIIVGSAIAVTGGIVEKPIVVAPVAIPLCGLLNTNGDFDSKTAARTDKLITAADRNCPDSKCGAHISTNDMVLERMMPGFLSDLKSEDAIDSIVENPNFLQCGPRWNRLLDTPTPAQAADQCVGRWDPNLRGSYFQTETGAWTTEYAIGKSSNNFAVWGLVGQHVWDNQEPERELIAALNRQVDPNLPVEQQAQMLGLAASIGDRFTILPQGATTANFQSALISRITEPAGSPPLKRWPAPYENYESLYKTEIVPRLGNLLEVNYFRRAVDPNDSVLRDQDDPTIFGTAGVCENWRRADHWNPNYFLPNRYGYLSRPLPIPLIGVANAGRFNGGPLSADTWEVNIPIIADQTSAQCENSLADTHPLKVNGDFRLAVDNPDRFIIVGFVRGVVYDSAIGTRDFAGPVRNADLGRSAAGHWPAAYSYVSPMGSGDNTCNFGRMRIKGDSSFIRWSNQVGSDIGRKTQLIDAKAET